MNISAHFLLIFLFSLSFLYAWLDLVPTPWYRQCFALACALCAAMYFAGR